MQQGNITREPTLMNDNDDLIFTLVLDEGSLQCRHDNIPIYVSSLRTIITIGHFVVLSYSHGRSLNDQRHVKAIVIYQMVSTEMNPFFID